LYPFYDPNVSKIVKKYQNLNKRDQRVKKEEKSVSSSCFLDYCYSVPQYFRISITVQNIIFLLFSIYFEREERKPLDSSGKKRKS